MFKMIRNVSQFFAAVAVAVLLNCRIWRVGGVVTSVYLYKILVCDDSYGVPLGERAYVASVLACAVSCLHTTSCESLTYNDDTKLCKFNGASWLKPTTTGCAVRVQYAGKEAPLIPVCQPGDNCTVPLNNVRLCNGGGPFVCDPSQGRVEVFFNGTWGTVCDDFWDVSLEYYEHLLNVSLEYYEHGIPNSNVICKMLGYGTGVPLTMAAYGEGVGPILMDDVRCNGNETSLFDCQFNEWKVNDCFHYEDVGVLCN